MKKRMVPFVLFGMWLFHSVIEAAETDALNCRGKESSLSISKAGIVTLEDHLVKKSCRLVDVRFFDNRRGKLSRITLLGGLRDCPLRSVWDALVEVELSFDSPNSGKGSLSARDNLGTVSCQFEKASSFDLDRVLKTKRP